MINRTFLQYAIKNMAKFKGTLKYRLPHIVGKLRLSSFQWYQFRARERNFSKRERTYVRHLWLLKEAKFRFVISFKRLSQTDWENAIWVYLTSPFLGQFSLSLGLRNLKFREEFKYGIYASIRTLLYHIYQKIKSEVRRKLFCKIYDFLD